MVSEGKEGFEDFAPPLSPTGKPRDKAPPQASPAVKAKLKERSKTALRGLAALAIELLPRKGISALMGRLAEQEWQPVLQTVIETYRTAYGIDLSDFRTPPAGFRTFNDFFTREVLPGTRPIAAGNEPCSPVDGTVLDCGPISHNDFWVKGTHYTLTELLGVSEAETQDYKDGSFVVIYLSPKDYHRVHAPESGSISRVTYQRGTLYPVNQIGIEHVPKLFARNERVTLHIDHQDNHRSALALVGAMVVGGIQVNCLPRVQSNKGMPSVTERLVPAHQVQKGAEVGRFVLGSTVVWVTTQKLPWRVLPGSPIRFGERLTAPRKETT